MFPESSIRISEFPLFLYFSHISPPGCFTLRLYHHVCSDAACLCLEHFPQKQYIWNKTFQQPVTVCFLLNSNECN